jgi:hypothetical protein
MAKYTSVVSLTNTDWTEVSAVANCLLTWAGGGAMLYCVADALADIDTELTTGHPLSQKNNRVELKGLGTKKVFVKGASGDSVIVTAYA